MSTLATAGQIWKLTPTPADLAEGARYAQISLPWTFDRMGKNSSPSSQVGAFGQCERALNIAKGIVAQEVLRRRLTSLGIQTEVQRKSHRQKDFFDLKVTINGKLKKLDLKSCAFYTNANPMGRELLSSNLIIKHAAYPGPDWRRFFPMLVPVDQVAQEKEAYCFALASSIDFRKDLTTTRVAQTIACFPTGVHAPFLQSQRLCVERESAGKGVHVALEWRPDGFFSPKALHVTIVGEWSGEPVSRTVSLPPRKQVTVGPFSCVASLIADADDFGDWDDGTLNLSIKKNEFTVPVLIKSTGRDVNIPPTEACVFRRKKDFCNLVLPSDYTIYFTGWTTKDDFLTACRKYPAWIFPNDKVNKFENGAWTQITESDKKKIEHAGFSSCVQKKPTAFNAGWLKMRACCYTYPNQFGSGLRDMNMYVLPQDLSTMATLGRI